MLYLGILFKTNMHFDKAKRECLNDADCTAFSTFNSTAVFVYRDVVAWLSFELRLYSIFGF